MLLALVALPTIAANPKPLAKCLLVLSYHKGYAWNDGIEQGVEHTLKNKCGLKIFYMDTKRNPNKIFSEKMALRAKSLIESYQPDIVIAAA